MSKKATYIFATLMLTFGIVGFALMFHLYTDYSQRDPHQVNDIRHNAIKDVPRMEHIEGTTLI